MSNKRKSSIPPLTCHIGGEEDPHMRRVHLCRSECEEAEEDRGLASVGVSSTSATVALHGLPSGLTAVDLQEVVTTLVG